MLTLTADDAASDAFLGEWVYCGYDAMTTLELRDILIGHLDDTTAATWAFETKLLGPIMSMMRRGIRIDLEERDRQLGDLAQRTATLEAGLAILTNVVLGAPINWRSEKQVKRLFYEGLHIEPIARRKGADWSVSTDRAILERLAKSYVRAKPMADILMRLRDLQGEAEVLQTTLSPEGRWHASFNPSGTVTGRWSSSSHPLRIGANIQNINKRMRRLFVADPDRVLVECDLQGADSVGVAYLSGDPNYIAAVNSGDTHTLVAGMVWGFEPTAENSRRVFYRDKSYRQVAKMMGHASNYMSTPATIAEQGHVEISLADDFQRRYFKAFPGIRKWQLQTIETVQKTQRLTTPFGRRRRFWGRTWDDAVLREAIAYAPQSLTCDTISEGLYRVWEELEPVVHLHAQVHDSVLLSIPASRLDLVPKILTLLRVPTPVTDINGVTRTMTIDVEAQVGLNWAPISPTNPSGLRAWKE